MGRLEGRVALVTGAARGLGRAIAEELVAEGARVAIGDVLDDEAQALASRLGERVVALHLDVTTEDSWADGVAATVAAFGSLNVLVNNAGTAEGGALAETSLESYRRVTEVNQSDPSLLAKIISPFGFGQPEDVAPLFAYLASDEARYVTGTVMTVDGGMTA